MDSSNSQAALYHPLSVAKGEIRVFTIHPAASGQWDDPLYCSLDVVSLISQPTYNALSYVWGHATERKPIQINGLEVQITRNLDTILRYIRGYAGDKAPLRSTALWADAICINQADPVERAVQVKIMGYVYHLANKVLSWIGEPDVDSNWALVKMNDADFLASVETLRSAERPHTANEVILYWALFQNLMQREYWERVWILQEVVVARDGPLLLCGQHSLSWGVFLRMKEILQDSLQKDAGDWEQRVRQLASELPLSRWDMSRTHDGGSSYSSSIQTHIWMRDQHRRREATSLATLLLPVLVLKVTDSRDYIYGIMNLLSPEEKDIITVDYTLPVASVFCDAWTGSLQLANSPTYACFGEVMPSFPLAVQEGAAAWPSWVPSIPATPGFNRYRGNRFYGSDQRGWRFPQLNEMSISGQALHLDAFEFDTVEEASEVMNFESLTVRERPWSGEEPQEPVAHTLKRHKAMAFRGRQRLIPDTDRLAPFARLRDVEPLWETMARWDDNDPRLDRLSAGVDGQDRAARLAKTKAILWNVLMGRQEMPETWPASLPESVREDPIALRHSVLSPCLKGIQHRCHDARVLLTAGGFFGVGSRVIEPGDSIVFLERMACPFIVRPFSDAYKLVGFAYVSGVMDWDRLDECMAKGTLAKRTFTIY